MSIPHTMTALNSEHIPHRVISEGRLTVYVNKELKNIVVGKW